MVSESHIHNPKERFGTLCHVAADISTLPFKVIYEKSGKVFFSRECDVVLFVGLEELKAQIRWIDSNVGVHGVFFRNYHR